MMVQDCFVFVTGFFSKGSIAHILLLSFTPGSAKLHTFITRAVF
jgi:hypothetical protein